MKSLGLKTIVFALAMTSGLSLPGWAKTACPLDSVTNAAKSHTLFLYFPTADDPTFPNYLPGTGVSPAKAFNVADLDPSIGTTSQLRNRIFDVVADDYCEFNIQVQQTTTNPDALPAPPARRNVVAVGSDVDVIGGAWGLAQDVDLKDQVNVDYARVWGGTYTQCEGSDGFGGCTTGSLTGANATLDRWAEAIGGTAAHEGGHNYGLSHTDDNPVNSTCKSGLGERPGEDTYDHHLMPAGCNLTGEARAGSRRHFSDRTFGLLATNVGLTIETMHNWDLINPNAQTATSLTIEFLSAKNAVTADWTYTGSQSPWINPKVSGILGTALWQGKQYNRFSITWSKPNPAWAGTPGVLPGGAAFHIGATFTGVDFNQPDPIIIQNITLFNASTQALSLHPRLPMYDSGTLDPATGDFSLHFFPDFAINPNPLILVDSALFQLPRVASIESMMGSGRPLALDGQEITPWSANRCVPLSGERETAVCHLGNLGDRPNVQVTHLLGEPGVVDCSQGVPRASRGDNRRDPDDEIPVCAGTLRDPFPSTTLYVIATFVDPKAEHYDPEKREMVVGPVVSRVFYQFAGVRDPRKLLEAAPRR
jgi:hypothetical protein